MCISWQPSVSNDPETTSNRRKLQHRIPRVMHKSLVIYVCSRINLRLVRITLHLDVVKSIFGNSTVIWWALLIALVYILYDNETESVYIGNMQAKCVLKKSLFRSILLFNGSWQSVLISMKPEHDPELIMKMLYSPIPMGLLFSLFVTIFFFFFFHFCG